MDPNNPPGAFELGFKIFENFMELGRENPGNRRGGCIRLKPPHISTSRKHKKVKQQTKGPKTKKIEGVFPKRH